MQTRRRVDSCLDGTGYRPTDTVGRIDAKWAFRLMFYLSILPWIKGIFTPDWLEAINYPCPSYVRKTIVPLLL